MACRIAIDGPAGSGKTTVARLVAQKLGIHYLDTGAMYRIVGLHLYRKGADVKSESLRDYLTDLKIEYVDGTFMVNGSPVGDEIRTPEAGMYASIYATHPDVRAFLTNMQKEICKNRDIVAEGRDIGTVVIPDAEVKIFLVASPEVRAKRRYLELIAKGYDVQYEGILREIIERDENDSSRGIAPLTKAPDAVEIDTSDLSVEEVVDRILELVHLRCKKKI
ncbi:(d)CMP kinase [Fervidobacterium thailandense]|uniref:Cytidylate kinase n=1 Tax=Fervidobacterium thailandense TaxID=1008305 RepID=A0A1E3G528_9BACT|nr:(d)CMP kinase [Fervidobacterium thailandense]ODN31391.1 cytidylate kinase [Fervidobacterium thailandense]